VPKAKPLEFRTDIQVIQVQVIGPVSNDMESSRPAPRKQHLRILRNEPIQKPRPRPDRI
jgi:hypothetical protein